VRTIDLPERVQDEVISPGHAHADAVVTKWRLRKTANRTPDTACSFPTVLMRFLVRAAAVLV
jgi:hypothetical protein